MKENTYDVPAYKFFIVKIHDGKREHSVNEYTYSLQNNPNCILRIPFEDVDGLTIHEVKGLLDTSDIALLGCIAYAVLQMCSMSILKMLILKKMIPLIKFLSGKWKKIIREQMILRIE